MNKFLCFFAACSFSFIALSSEELISPIPDVPEQIPWAVRMIKLSLSQFPDFNIWFAASMFFVMAVMRAAAEFLNFIAKKTETTKDDEIAIIFHDLAAWLSALIGWFGLGKPK